MRKNKEKPLTLNAIVNICSPGCKTNSPHGEHMTIIFQAQGIMYNCTVVNF
jgi:hypothetical protein